MSATTVVADVLLGISLVVCVLAVFGALALRTTYGKLHYLTPVSTVAAPLFAAALIVDTGWGITAGLEILIVGLVVVSGPLLQATIGHIEAQTEGRLTPEEPQ